MPKINHFVLIFPSRQAESTQDRNNSSSVMGPYASQSQSTVATHNNIIAHLVTPELEVARVLLAGQLLVKVRRIKWTGEEQRGKSIRKRKPVTDGGKTQELRGLCHLPGQ